MNETLNEIGQSLKDHLSKNNTSPEKFSNESGINKQQLYSVLRMGNPARPNYSISTLVKIIDYLGLKISFKRR